MYLARTLFARMCSFLALCELSEINNLSPFNQCSNSDSPRLHHSFIIKLRSFFAGLYPLVYVELAFIRQNNVPTLSASLSQEPQADPKSTQTEAGC